MIQQQHSLRRVLGMTCWQSIATCACVAIVTGPCLGDTVSHDFEDGSNPASWSFNVTNPDVIELSGGNPDRWLHNDFVSSFAPIMTSAAGADTAFHGDYRVNGVTAIRIDARTDFASFGAGGRDFSLLLRDTKGTPSNFDDDDYAYFVGELVPQVGEGWVSYEFVIPSADTSAVPVGWRGGYSGDPENFRPGIDWNDLIVAVDRVEFWWINPSFFAIFQTWDVGVDSIAIDLGPTNPCTTDLDENGSTDVDDLLTLLGNWGTDGEGSDIAEPSNIVDVDDLLALLAAWGPC